MTMPFDGKTTISDLPLLMLSHLRKHGKMPRGHLLRHFAKLFPAWGRGAHEHAADRLVADGKAKLSWSDEDSFDAIQLIELAEAKQYSVGHVCGWRVVEGGRS